MIRLIALDVPDSMASKANELLDRMRRELTASAASDSETGAKITTTNKGRVRALQARCRLLGRDVKVSDVVAVADLDESQFYKWQRGAYVGFRVQLRCNEPVGLSADEFLGRLDGPATAKTPEAEKKVETSTCFPVTGNIDA